MKRVILLASLLVVAACGERSTLPPATALSPVGGNDVGAGYSPDGSRIYWWTQAGNKWQLWQSPADMSTPKQVPILSASTGFPVWSPDGSRFAVGASIETTLPRVYVVDTAGGPARRLTKNDALEQPLLWNPDGKRLSYLTLVGSTIMAMVVNVDSGVPTRLVPEETKSHVALWSPDGTKLAVDIFDGGQSTIGLADSLGGHFRQLTSEGFENLAGGSTGTTPWAPDGKTLLYTSNRTGASDIWALPIDGSPPRQLTNDVRSDDNPIWSPDGEWIAFVSDRGLQTDLWVMPAAGGPAERVTDNMQSETLIGWRPNTNQLAYTTGKTLAAVWAHRLADGAERRLTPDSSYAPWYSVSGNGELEVTFNRGGGVYDFSVMPLAGGEPKTLLKNTGGQNAYWSSDGSKLAFSSNRGGSNDIWVLDAAGGAPRQLTSWPGREDYPVWSTDGSQLYFWSDHDAKWGDIWRVSVAGGTPARVTTQGRFVDLCTVDTPSPVLLARTIGGGPNTIDLVRIRSDGRVQMVWNRTAAGCGSASPAGDSLVVSVGAAGGGQVGMLLPIDGGPGRQLLPEGEFPLAWSPDGTQLSYSFKDGNINHSGILTVADGAQRHIGNSSANESAGQWSPDGSELLMNRVVNSNQITTSDLTKLLGAKQ